MESVKERVIRRLNNKFIFVHNEMLATTLVNTLKLINIPLSPSHVLINHCYGINKIGEVIRLGCEALTPSDELLSSDEFIGIINEELNDMVDNQQEQQMREFSTGATRNIDTDKLDYEGFLSPLALKTFAEYMHKNRKQADDKLRDSDNWQKGIPVDAYMKSMWRHFFDTWSTHRGVSTPEDQITNLCGLMFNVQGMLHELLKEHKNDEPTR